MIRYGALAQKMRPMAADDIFITRLILLIIMAKAYLKGFPQGDFRKSAIKDNARLIFSEARYRTGRCLLKPSMDKTPDPANDENLHSDYLFLQRVQLLAVMANAFVDGKAHGNFRKRAMAENIRMICEYLSDRIQLADAQFLKVA